MSTIRFRLQGFPICVHSMICYCRWPTDEIAHTDSILPDMYLYVCRINMYCWMSPSHVEMCLKLCPELVLNISTWYRYE